MIKYCSSDAAAQARHLLNARVYDGSYDLVCDWLNSGHLSLSALHSKTLYVDGLPAGFRDQGEFRRAFSVVKNPAFCQIAIKKGVLQDWGLVEFFDPADTEETRRRAGNVSLGGGPPVRVHFCVPGVRAIDIHMQTVNAPAYTKKNALLNDTPSANVYSQLQNLAQHNPDCEY